MKEQDLTKMEFLLTLNDRIIVQRFYNVKNYNEDAKNSHDLYEFVRSFKEELEQDLKSRTVNYMLDNIIPIMEDENVLNTEMTDGEENFNIYIKNGETVLLHRQFNAKLYPPKIRYTVDVRPFLKDLLKGLTEIFSEKNLTFEYLGLPLQG